MVCSIDCTKNSISFSDISIQKLSGNKAAFSVPCLAAEGLGETSIPFPELMQPEEEVVPDQESSQRCLKIQAWARYWSQAGVNACGFQNHLESEAGMFLQHM